MPKEENPWRFQLRFPKYSRKTQADMKRPAERTGRSQERKKSIDISSGQVVE